MHLPFFDVIEKQGPMESSPRSRQHAAHSVATLVAWIDDNISQGNWPSGMKLPTERELEERLKVSRNTLRKGLRSLEAQGKIARHVGRGSFVTADKPQVPSKPIVKNASQLGMTQNLLDTILGSSPADIMEIRLLLEPAAAELAAHRASSDNLATFNGAIAKMAASRNIKDFEYWDGVLHMSIIAAARNELLTAIYKTINEARNQPEWIEIKRRSMTPERRATYHRQHEDLVAALTARDGEAARDCALIHLRVVRENLLSGTIGS
jgi:DNA-binding FadR family transcriptional regulator